MLITLKAPFAQGIQICQEQASKLIKEIAVDRALLLHDGRSHGVWICTLEGVSCLQLQAGISWCHMLSCCCPAVVLLLQWRALL